MWRFLFLGTVLKFYRSVFSYLTELICIFENLTLPQIMTKKLSILSSIKVAEYSEAKSAKRSFKISRILIFDAKLLFALLDTK